MVKAERGVEGSAFKWVRKGVRNKLPSSGRERRRTGLREKGAWKWPCLGASFNIEQWLIERLRDVVPPHLPPVGGRRLPDVPHHMHVQVEEWWVHTWATSGADSVSLVVRRAKLRPEPERARRPGHSCSKKMYADQWFILSGHDWRWLQPMDASGTCRQQCRPPPSSSIQVTQFSWLTLYAVLRRGYRVPHWRCSKVAPSWNLNHCWAHRASLITITLWLSSLHSFWHFFGSTLCIPRFQPSWFGSLPSPFGIGRESFESGSTRSRVFPMRTDRSSYSNFGPELALTCSQRGQSYVL